MLLILWFFCICVLMVLWMPATGLSFVVDCWSIATDASVCSSLVVYCPAANYPEHEDEGAFSSFVLWCLCAHVVLLILSLLWALFRWCTTRLEHYNALAPLSFSWSSWRWNIMHFWDVNENKSCFRTVNALLIVAFRQIRQHWWKLLKLRFKLNS